MSEQKATENNGESVEAQVEVVEQRPPLKDEIAMQVSRQPSEIDFKRDFSTFLNDYDLQKAESEEERLHRLSMDEMREKSRLEEEAKTKQFNRWTSLAGSIFNEYLGQVVALIAAGFVLWTVVDVSSGVLRSDSSTPDQKEQSTATLTSILAGAVGYLFGSSKKK